MERNTRQHEIIRSILADCPAPLTVEQILALGQRSLANLSRATVYRAVKHLVETAWLRAVLMPSGTVAYEPVGRTHHHFFHCRDCDRLYSIERCPGDLNDYAPPGFRAEGHEIMITGLCASCQMPAVPRAALRPAAAPTTAAQTTTTTAPAVPRSRRRSP